MCWADIPQLSTRDRRCPAAWQQSRPNGTDRRPSVSRVQVHVWSSRADPSSLPVIGLVVFGAGEDRYASVQWCFSQRAWITRPRSSGGRSLLIKQSRWPNGGNSGRDLRLRTALPVKDRDWPDGSSARAGGRHAHGSGRRRSNPANFAIYLLRLNRLFLRRSGSFRAYSRIFGWSQAEPSGWDQAKPS